MIPDMPTVMAHFDRYEKRIRELELRLHVAEVERDRALLAVDAVRIDGLHLVGVDAWNPRAGWNPRAEVA